MRHQQHRRRGLERVLQKVQDEVRDFGLFFRESENKIVQRSTIKLQEIKDNIYAFMLTPKDAFRQVSFSFFVLIGSSTRTIPGE